MTAWKPLLTLEDIAAEIGGGLARMPAYKQRKYLKREIRRHKIPYSRIVREWYLTPENFGRLLDALTICPSSSSNSKIQKTGMSGGRSAARRSMKALDYVMQNSQKHIA